MRTFLMPLCALSLALPTTLAIPVSQAGATTTRHHYYGRTRHRHYRYCRRSPGNTGLIAGGVGGALVGRSVLGHGILGTVGGAVGGALAGRAVDRTLTAHRRCR